MSELGLTGGCHCGQARYVLSAAPERAELCHCRDCQKAVGAVFGAFADVRRDAFRWLTQPPATYASSPGVQRGFCRTCGASLTYDAADADTIGVALGSLDAPDRVPATGHCGIQSKLAWLTLNDGLPQRRTGEAFPAQDHE